MAYRSKLRSNKNGDEQLEGDDDSFIELTDTTPDIGAELERTQVINENHLTTDNSTISVKTDGEEQHSSISQYINDIRVAVNQEHVNEEPNVATSVISGHNQSTDFCGTCNNGFYRRSAKCIQCDDVNICNIFSVVVVNFRNFDFYRSAIFS